MFTGEEIARATCGKLLASQPVVVSGVSTDSRLISAGELFIPLRGLNFDGHAFLTDVVVKGVTVALAEQHWLRMNSIPAGLTIIEVQDTLRALGDLAAVLRRRFLLPMVGITGSNGKTTTKEMLASILSFVGAGLKTSGNLNNLIGLPQMLFRLQPDHVWGVLEMGMSEPGEIDRLAEIAQPTVGVITNAFPAHLESMGSVENVAKAKGELFMRLPAGAFAIYNADDPLIAALPTPEGVKRISFGLSDADVTATVIANLGLEGQCFNLHLTHETLSVKLPAFGRHNVYNALAAAAAADVLGIEAETIKEGLEKFQPYDKRFNLELVGGLTIIDDTYNANPASMEAALNALAELKESSRAIAVLGDMLELGKDTAELHRQLGEKAAKVVQRLYVMGAMARYVAEGACSAGLSSANIIVADEHDTLVADILKKANKGDFILIKGSRGMRMEAVAAKLRSELAPQRAKRTVA